ncbi:MAG: fibro-slime domain-containing protein, partial [Oscillospiraceae bacterium]|nr:fibro-slime domain-containing protein [Oscillospiraceae bacterium]
MKTFFGKRLVALLLALVMVLGLVPVVATPKTEAATLDWQTLRSTVQNLAYPVATRVTSLPNDMSGLWVITNYVARGDDPSQTKKYVMNPDSQSHWLPPTYVNEHYGYEVIPVNRLSNDSNKLNISHSKYYTRITGTKSAMQLRDYRGLYWDHIYGAAGNTFGYFQLTTWDKVYYTAQDAGNSTYRVIRNDATNLQVFVNGYSFRVAITGKLPVDKNPDYQLEFYKVSEDVLRLREVLQESLKYVVDNSSGRFDQTAYQNYLTFINDAVGKYNDKYVSASYNSAYIADAVTLKNQIWDQMAKMKLADTSEEYIDIPIEVLDFRGDGFLFEGVGAWESVYSLSCMAPDINDSRYPGKYVQVGNYANVEDGFHIEELVEDELVNGRVIYTQKTVDYIAYHMYHQTSLDRLFIGNKMNMAIYTKVTGGTLRYDSVNGYANTLTRCVPAQIGGEMHWNAIETYHDLAYFMLSHMWTETTDIIGQDTLKDNTTLNNYTFNMPIPELSKLRLFKNGSSYSYNSSNNASCYNYGFIFNDSTNRDRSDPWFRPLSNRGFESPSLYGNVTEPPYTNGVQYKPEINYCFSLHAYGSFVYTQDSELYFKFGGDDDVYFFINGKLVCDLGGIHGHVEDEVKLNDRVENGTLSLKEGQICRFDMFYMDRHTTGINMNFSTNMKIMDESVITEKTQYDPT